MTILFYYLFWISVYFQIKRKVELLRIACLKHDELMNEATNGFGEHCCNLFKICYLNQGFF